MMPRYSLTEIEAHCRKASRGAGYHWGEADEAGKAVRWLCTKGMNGPEYLLDMLEQVDGNCETFRPTSAVLQGEVSTPICGLSLGCALADRGYNKLSDVKLTTTVIGPVITYGVVGNALPDMDLGGLAKVVKVDVAHGAKEFTDVSDTLWNALNVFVHRTYVPATEESRLKGAG